MTFSMDKLITMVYTGRVARTDLEYKANLDRHLPAARHLDILVSSDDSNSNDNSDHSDGSNDAHSYSYEP